MKTGRDLWGRAVSSAVFPLHEWLKGHSSRARLRELEASQWWDRDRIGRVQLDRLRALVDAARRNVPYYRRVLTDVGVDIVELTGNHNMDYNTQSYLDTLQWYRDHNIQTIGGGVNQEAARQPLILKHNGSTIIMLACNAVGPYYALADENAPGAAACDRDWLRATLPTLADQSDLLILLIVIRGIWMTGMIQIV